MKYVSQNVLLIFIIKDAALMHEIRNSKDFKKNLFLTFKWGCHCLLASLEYATDEMWW